MLSLVSAALQPPDDSGGRWTGGFAYAPHNHGAAWVRDPCDYSILDVPPLPAPTGVTATAVAGGTLVAGTYGYVVTFSDANGQTTGSAQANVTTVSTGSVRVAWTMPVDAAERGITAKVYGRVAGSLGLIGSGIGTNSFTDTGSATPGAAVPSSNTTGGPGIYVNLPIVEHVPTLAVVEDRCSTWGFSERDFKGRATTLLENATSTALAFEFWAGIQAQKEGYPNDYLTNPATCVDITPGTTPSINRGVQILEDALASNGFGGKGMIHVQPQTTPDSLIVRREGPLLLTQRDNIVVADTGYTGWGPNNVVPAAGTAYIYATDLVSVRIDSIRVIPDSFEEALDRGNNGEPNTITFRAERFVAATFDGSAHFACKVALSA